MWVEYVNNIAEANHVEESRVAIRCTCGTKCFTFSKNTVLSILSSITLQSHICSHTDMKIVPCSHSDMKIVPCSQDLWETDLLDQTALF